MAGAVPRSVRGQVTVALVPDARMRRLNAEYRNADYATDVLSFPGDQRPPSGQRPAATGQRPFLGDIAIAKGVAARQARAQGHSLATELRVLALHGLLHLLGYDHERDDGTMAAVERRLRRKGGIPAGLIERGGRP
jgi:probable rRNA maturation factor